MKEAMYVCTLPGELGSGRPESDLGQVLLRPTWLQLRGVPVTTGSQSQEFLYLIRNSNVTNPEPQRCFQHQIVGKSGELR
jgi:hypothetical protein